MSEDRKADVVMMKYGSHLYGLDTPKSDTDYKGVFLNTIDELIMGDGPDNISYSTGPKGAKNSAGDVDYEISSLHSFIKDAIAGQTWALDMLHCTNPSSDSDVWKFLVANRTKFYSRNMKSYIGFVKSQAAKYGMKGTRVADIKQAREAIRVEYKRKVDLSKPYANIPAFGDWLMDTKLGEIKDKLFYGAYANWVELKNTKSGAIDEYYEVNSKKYQSTNSLAYVYEKLTAAEGAYGYRAHLAEQNDGVDWKALSHALRAGYQALHIYNDGDYAYPLPETEFLKAVKLGELDYKTVVAPALEKVVEDVDAAAVGSTLPEAVDSEFWKGWLVDHYRNKFHGATVAAWYKT